jgi:hypothetical protein
MFLTTPNMPQLFSPWVVAPLIMLLLAWICVVKDMNIFTLVLNIVCNTVLGITLLSASLITVGILQGTLPEAVGQLAVTMFCFTLEAWFAALEWLLVAFSRAVGRILKACFAAVCCLFKACAVVGGYVLGTGRPVIHAIIRAAGLRDWPTTGKANLKATRGVLKGTGKDAKTEQSRQLLLPEPKTVHRATQTEAEPESSNPNMELVQFGAAENDCPSHDPYFGDDTRAKTPAAAPGRPAAGGNAPVLSRLGPPSYGREFRASLSAVAAQRPSMALQPGGAGSDLSLALPCPPSPPGASDEARKKTWTAEEVKIDRLERRAAEYQYELRISQSHLSLQKNEEVRLTLRCGKLEKQRDRVEASAAQQRKESDGEIEALRKERDEKEARLQQMARDLTEQKQRLQDAVARTDLRVEAERKGKQQAETKAGVLARRLKRSDDMARKLLAKSERLQNEAIEKGEERHKLEEEVQILKRKAQV